MLLLQQDISNQKSTAKQPDGLLAAMNTFTVPNSSTGVATGEVTGTFFQGQALMFARLYGGGNNWLTSVRVRAIM